MKLKTLLVLLILLTVLPCRSVNSQLPSPIVIDAPNNVANGVVMAFQIGFRSLLRAEEGIIGVINNIQDFISKANSLVNTSVKNLRLVRQIVNLHNDILEMQSKYVATLDEEADFDGDGNISLEEIDYKWKSIKVSLGLVKESTGYFQVFSNVLDDNAFTMDDEGRINLIAETYTDLIKIKGAMRLHIRRTNRKNRDFQKLKREYQTYKAFFSKN